MINVILAFMIIGSFLVAVIIHEYGHALVATMLGDPTPRAEGRLSLSLRSHIDPLGTLLCVILAFFNLIPLHPLDGYQIVYTLLPSRQAVSFARSAPYGQFIILLLIFLLPFLGQISGLGDFFLFHISYYILLGSMKLMSLASGFNDGALLLLYIA